jgi:hypothetical protein
MPDDLVSALYWACYVFEMNVFSEGYELKRYGEDEGEDTDIWGILGDIEEDVENWNWMKDIDLIG